MGVCFASTGWLVVGSCRYSAIDYGEAVIMVDRNTVGRNGYPCVRINLNAPSLPAGRRDRRYLS